MMAKIPLTDSSSLMHLVEDSLEVVQETMHLSSLLSTPNLNRRWSKHVHDSCQRRPSLTLLVGNKDWYDSLMAEYQENKSRFDDPLLGLGWTSRHRILSSWEVNDAIWIPQLSNQIVSRILNLFTRFSSLSLAISQIDAESVIPLVTLLNELENRENSARLRTFNLVTYKSVTIPRNEFLLPFIERLNSLEALENLSLFCCQPLAVTVGNNVNLNLSVLSQLRSFAFFSNDRVNLVLNQIGQHATENPNLRNVALKSALSSPFDIDIALELPDEVARLFSELRIETTLNFHLSRLFRKFTHVTILHFDVHPWTVDGIRPRQLQPNFAEISIFLSRHLRHLVTLRLKLKFPQGLTSETQSQIASLKNVAALFIQVDQNLHSDFASLLIKKCFPCITVMAIFLSIPMCPKCGPYPNLPSLGESCHASVVSSLLGQSLDRLYLARPLLSDIDNLNIIVRPLI